MGWAYALANTYALSRLYQAVRDNGHLIRLTTTPLKILYEKHQIATNGRRQSAHCSKMNHPLLLMTVIVAIIHTGKCESLQRVSISTVNLSSRIINYVNYTREIKASIVMVKSAFNKKKILFTIELDLKFKGENTKVLHLEHSFEWC
jgi:hypothetical protein